MSDPSNSSAFAGATGGILLAAKIFLLTGCVTEVYVEEPVDPEPVETQPIIIERQPPEVTSDPRYPEFQNVQQQLRSAYSDRDVGEMRRILATYRNETSPDWAKASFDQFAQLVPAVVFEQQVQDSGQILMRTEEPVAGAEIDFLITIPEVPGSPLMLPEGLEDCRFSVETLVTDTSPFGEKSTQRTSAFIGVPEDTAIGSTRLELPFRLAALPGADARRDIEITVDLLPGNAISGDAKVPLRRTRVTVGRFTAWPQGVAAIRKQPKKHFDVFLRRRSSDAAKTVYVAAQFLEGQEKNEAIDEMLRLLKIVSLDDSAFIRFGTATLQVLTGADVPLNDRDAWINWGEENR